MASRYVRHVCVGYHAARPPPPVQVPAGISYTPAGSLIRIAVRPHISDSAELAEWECARRRDRDQVLLHGAAHPLIPLGAHGQEAAVVPVWPATASRP